jgi:hypothetical protein
VEQHAAGEPQFLLVAQVLDRRVDVPVEAEIAYLDIGLIGTDREVELAPAQRQIVLVEAEAVGDVDQPAVADAGPPDDVGELVGQAGALGEDRRPADDPVALSDVAGDREVRAIERPVDAVGDA